MLIAQSEKKQKREQEKAIKKIEVMSSERVIVNVHEARVGHSKRKHKCV